MSTPSRFSRRQFLRTGAVAGAALVVAPGRAPAFVRSRPSLTHGIQSGDVTAQTGIVWGRADRPSRMLVDVARTPSFRGSRRIEGPVLTPDTDFTGKVLLDALPPGQETFYRVTLEDLDEPGLLSEPLDGSLRTAPRGRRDVSFTWSGDLAGQGWGINPEFGGYRIFAAMEALEPDFFVCSGDTVYADGPLKETVPLSGGRTWRNVITPAKLKVAETLDEFRGQFAYNLLDENLRSFAARVPQVYQWDDHEVRNNWFPGQIITDPRYTETRADVLAVRAKQAFFEWLPITPPARGDEQGRIYRRISYGPLLDVFVLDMRTFKDPNGPNAYADPRLGLLGPEQRAWLKRELAASSATWKVIANDLPLGLVIPNAPPWEGVAQGDPGAPLGRELEFAEVLSSAHRAGVQNIVFITADVHYTAAHRYDPARAAIGDFTPFWEFVSGPLNAGGFDENPLDATFGPEAVFVKAPLANNTSPADGFQFFGHVAIDGGSRVMTVSLRDLDGKVLFSVDLEAEGKNGDKKKKKKEEKEKKEKTKTKTN